MKYSAQSTKGLFLFILLPWMLVTPRLYCLTESQASETTDTSVTIYAGGGFLETAVIGADFPVMPNFRVGVKLNSVVNGGGVQGDVLFSRGAGIKISHSFEDRKSWINIINVEVSYLYSVGHQNRPPYGLGFESTVGFRNNIKGIHWFWDIGGGFTIAQNIPSLFFPCLKVGLQLNL